MTIDGKDIRRISTDKLIELEFQFVRREVPSRLGEVIKSIYYDRSITPSWIPNRITGTVHLDSRDLIPSVYI